jgi:glycosyltransferase involved in cell wall biosynthesis
MRIAQVAPLYESVPPKKYGGTERVVSWLTEELVRLGHDVTLFASGDSMTTARLVSVCENALRLDPRCTDQLAHHMLMLEQVLSEKDNFDLIHFHIDYLHFSLSRRENLVQVSTLHGRLDIPGLAPLYSVYRDMPVISISDAQRDPLPWANWQGTVHHGMPKDQYSLCDKTGDYLAFLGRISPEKGVPQAIEIAKKSGMPLKVAAKIDKADAEYYQTVIKPLLKDPIVEFVGEIGYPEKNDFLGNAAALLFPIQWQEPFGIVMIEAMACGTPVIAYPYGSVPEVIEDGITGFIVRDVKGAVQALKTIETFDRGMCRRRFEQRFTDKRMTKDYLAIYQHVLKGKLAPVELSDGVLSWTKLALPSSTT